jgi:hypothetical protein
VSPLALSLKTVFVSVAIKIEIFYEVPEVSVTVTLVCDVLAEVNVSWIASMSGCPLELLETLVPHKGCCECH